MLEKYFQREKSSTVISNMQMGAGVVQSQMEELAEISAFNPNGKSRVDILEDKMKVAESDIDRQGNQLTTHCQTLNKQRHDIDNLAGHRRPKPLATQKDIFPTAHYISCAFTIPAEANKIQVEMWGPGGGGPKACCCGGGCYGGQGGSYGRKTIDVSRIKEVINATTCVTGCCCYNTTCVVTQSTVPTCLCLATGSGDDAVSIADLRVTGGVSGQGACNMRACCTAKYGTQNKYDTRRLAGYNPSTGKLSFCSVGGSTTSTHCVFDEHNKLQKDFDYVIDEIFKKEDCANFDVYRRGACGFSSVNLEGNNAYQCGMGPNPCSGNHGVGGAAYLGGDQQLYQCANCMGQPGNFPAGGGKASMMNTDGVTCGGPGAGGLVSISWE